MGNMRQRVSGRAHTEPGVLRLQVGGVDSGGLQDDVNFPTNDPLVPEGSSGVTTEGAPKAELTLTFAEPTFPEIGRFVTVQGSMNAGAIPLFTVPTGMEAIVLGASARVVSASGVTLPATAGIGTNVPADNMFESQELSGLLDPGNIYDFPPGGASVVAVAGETISLGVDDGFTGTSQVAEIMLFGYLRTA